MHIDSYLFTLSRSVNKSLITCMNQYRQVLENMVGLHAFGHPLIAYVNTDVINIKQQQRELN
jgi:hypothetical protein